MATVIGTSGNDFIHRKDDGQATPPGYHEVNGVTTNGDTIDGGEGDDIIYGDEGNDILIGGAGTDQLFGGDDDDYFWINVISDADGLTETFDGGEGLDILQVKESGIIDLTNAQITSVEYLTFGPFLDVTLYIGIEQISGVKLIGGGSSNIEVFMVDSGIIKFDTVMGGTIFHAFSGDDDVSIGNMSSVKFACGDGNDVFKKTGTAQSMYLEIDGGDGNDEIFVFSSRSPTSRTSFSELNGGNGKDKIELSFGENNILNGGGGKDVLVDHKYGNDLIGGDGSDKITGGQGADTITGGSGADLFIYKSTKDTLVGDGGHDVVLDFSSDQGDIFDLSRIDADTTVDGDQAFHLGGSAFTNTPGELIQYVDGEGHTILAGDSSGDGFAEFEIVLWGAPVLTASDFIL